jgi:formate hydrogenlyase transcriptional activator
MGISNKDEVSRQLTAEEEPLRLLINTTPALIHTALPDGSLDFLNQRWLEYMGLPLRDLLGWGWTSAIHPAEVDEFVDKWRASVLSGEPFLAESRVRRADGKYHRFLHRKVPLRDELGKIVKWYGSSIEIEERKRAGEQPLLEAQLQATLNMIPAYTWYAGSSGALTFVNERTADYFGLPKDHHLRFGIDIGAEWDSHIPLLHPDDHEEARRVWSTCLRTGCAGQVSFRVRNAEGGYRWHLSRAEPVRASDGTLLYWIGVNLDIEDRKRAEEELRRGQAYLSEAQRLSHTGSFGWDVSTGEIYWSEETFRIFELDPKTKVTIDLIVERTYPDDRPAVQQLIERVSRERTEFALEHRLLMPDGSIKYLRVVGRPSTDEGRRSEFVGAATDITDQKRSEESLRESEAYLAEAQRLSHTGSWAWSPKTGIRYWSEECYRVLGFDPRDGVPPYEEFFQRIHPDDQVEHLKASQRVIHEQIDVETEYRVVHPSGVVRNIQSTGHCVIGPSGDVIELIGTVIDVTDRKRAEEELRDSERRHRFLVDTTPAFLHTALPNGDLDFLNRGWLEYVGLPITDLLGWCWTSAIHPEDVEDMVAKWRGSLESGEHFVAESRVRRADGEYRWFLHHKEALRNELGEIVKWYGSSIEIQERKTAEEKIREQETELRQILDLTPQHIGVLAPDGSRLYLNHTALEYCGITLEQWREPGRVHNELVHPEDREHVLYERNKRFLEGEPHEFEARLLRHDGEFRWFLFRLTPLKDEQGQITRWYATGTDIEDRKRAEEGIRKENMALREEIAETSMFEEIVGESPALQAVLTRVAKVAPTDSTVLITGETGTGKELIARAIHKRSKRSGRAFVSVNCAALPPSLITSELFGHEKGSFTGATTRRLGRFELAEGGTIFLDEIGELPAETQVALLRVLQEYEFERVGGSRSIKADVRVIVATNRDLQAAMAAGTFRSDLFYRLHVFPIEMPPLRERSEDIPLLVEYFIDRYARKAGKNIRSVSKKTLDLFQSYPWPGNIRELQNVIERSIIVCETESFTVDESWLSRKPTATEPTGQTELAHKLTALEKETIEAALTESGGRVFGPSGAAAKLGVSRSTLESKIRTLKIDKHRFKVSNHL